jgi:hypothetical protein
LQALEAQLSHNHLYDWKKFHRHPLFDLIRHEPRYIEALAERERRINKQREELALLVAQAGS